MRPPHTKQLPWPELLARREAHRVAGETVVWTNGTFDLLHPGHVSSLQSARQLGAVLIVGLNSDASVRSYKGPSRPILTQDERAVMVCALECVDYVLIFEEPTPEVALAKLKPDIHCKGAEYAPPHGRPIPEADLVRSYGGRIKFLPLVPGISTTELLKRIRDKG